MEFTRGMRDKLSKYLDSKSNFQIDMKSAYDRSRTLCFGEIIYGYTPDSFEFLTLEMYSRPNSEQRTGYKSTKVIMDIGSNGRSK